MAIAQINKQIRRSVGEVPEGELIVALIPGDEPSLDLKIKGHQKSINRPIKELYEELKAGPEDEAQAPVGEAAQTSHELIMERFLALLPTTGWESENQIDPERVRHLAKVIAQDTMKRVLAESQPVVEADEADEEE